MSKHSISIIIPTYKRAHLLPRALDSVFAQTQSDFKVVVVDDASPDNTQDVIQHYASDPRLSYFRHANNRGVSYNRNFACQQTESDYCLFLDDDDSLAPQAIATIHTHLSAHEHNLDFSWVGRRIISCDNHQEREIATRCYTVSSKTTPLDLDFFCYWANPGFIIKRDVLLALGGYDERMSMMEDIDLLARLLNANKQYVSIPELLLNYYIEMETPSLSRHGNRQKEIWHTEYYAQKNSSFLSKHPKLWRRMAHSLLGCYYRQGEIHQAHNLAKRMWKQRPWDSKLWGRIIEFEIFKRHRYRNET